jgi:hypothetical protein
MNRKIALRAACALLLTWSLRTGAALAENPLGIAWKTTTDVELYGKPTGMLVAGRCNVTDPKFADARAKGAEVLLYLDPVERPDRRVCAQDEKFYMGDRARVPLWPYPGDGQRINWQGMHLTDMRPGSPWIMHVVEYVETLMREGKVDGVFLDVVGGQLWSRLANWRSWSQSEKDAWTDGNIDLVKRLDAKRRAINPSFIIVNNNVWHRDGDDRAGQGERYVDGVVFEHTKLSSDWHKRYAGKRFSDLGHRRVLVIANNESEALQWAEVSGVTHVSDQTKAQYAHPNVPVVAFHRLVDRKKNPADAERTHALQAR